LSAQKRLVLEDEHGPPTEIEFVHAMPVNPLDKDKSRPF
jgi:hypothetical protein